MKFSRVDKDTVRCIITEEDMKEYGLNIEDFFNDKGKSREFLESIVEQAEKEVGYRVKNGVLAIQIMPLPQNSLAITFSENGSKNFMDIFEHIKDVGEVSGEFKNIDINQPVKAQSKSKSKGKGKKQPILNIYKFESLKNVEQYCCAITIDKVFTSKLYKDEKDNSYYLIINKGRLAAETYETVCDRALEFAVYVSDSFIYAAHCEEHYTCLIKKKAINVMRNIGLGQ
ncbi:adaptor protein MecA [Anaerocolumna sp.]|uniref:adaptor protein MecA n=1 Tax=Anaerocolumna sp. TaxID=2041569 RepID=UPI0028AA9140|nr:adaptor protein MecA [Anaerocolumna sp.]